MEGQVEPGTRVSEHLTQGSGLEIVADVVIRHLLHSGTSLTKLLTISEDIYNNEMGRNKSPIPNDRK
jgi:hypothetical protein